MKKLCETHWAAVLTDKPDITDTREDHRGAPTKFVPDPGESCSFCPNHATHYAPDNTVLPAEKAEVPAEAHAETVVLSGKDDVVQITTTK